MSPHHTSVSRRTLVLPSQKERVQILMPEKQDLWNSLFKRSPSSCPSDNLALLWAWKSNTITTHTAHCYSLLLHTTAEQADPSEEQSSCIFTVCSRMRAAENILGPGDVGHRELAFTGGCEVCGDRT